MVLRDLYTKYVKILRNNKVVTPELDCKILLSFLLDVEIKDIFYCIDEEVYIEENLNKLINRRIKGEPISKIINKKSFWSYDFYVNETVLDPRPDSEVLIECILNDFNLGDNLEILDLGTGSGCLILTLLKIFKNSKGIAVDKNSLYVAKRNAKLLNIKNIKFIKSNWNDSINNKFDIIISNPPYIKTEIIPTLDIEVKKYDPIEALDGGKDGLDCYRYIANNILKNCKKNTKIYLEIGYDQKNSVISIFNNFKTLYCKKDLANNDRVLVLEV